VRCMCVSSWLSVVVDGNVIFCSWLGDTFVGGVGNLAETPFLT
jgi:hypothetical protein